MVFTLFDNDFKAKLEIFYKCAITGLSKSHYKWPKLWEIKPP
jgi:hypothetical protein